MHVIYVMVLEKMKKYKKKLVFGTTENTNYEHVRFVRSFVIIFFTSNKRTTVHSSD